MKEHLLKRSLSLLLALVMIFSVVPVQAFAADDDFSDGGEEGVSAVTTDYSEEDDTVSFSEEETEEEEIPEAPVLTGISISAVPGKTAYAAGEVLDVTGGEITLSYSDGTTKTVAMTADMVTGFDSSEAGEKSLTVNYEGFGAAYTVTVQAPAENEAPAVTEETKADLPENEEEDLLKYLRSQLTAYIETYGLSLDMPDLVLARVYASMGYEKAMGAWNLANELMDQAKGLNASDVDALFADQNTKLCLRFYNVMEQSSRMVAVAAETYTPVEGVSISIDHSNKADGSVDEVSDGALTVTAKLGKATGCGANTVYAVDTVTIMVYNDSDATGNLTFKYTSEGCIDQENEFKIDGQPVTMASGTFTKLVEKGTSVAISFKTSALGTGDSILKLYDFEILSLRESVNLTVGYDASLGTVTTNGAAVAADSVLEIKEDTVLAAKPNSGAAFVAWVDEEGKVLSKETSYTVFLTDDQTVNAIFSSTSDAPWFDPGDGYLYHDLNEAVTKGTKVVVACDGTLPAGNYTIPAGVTLLVPFDDSDTLYTDKPIGDNTAYVKPTAYRTLTLASGANLTVEGAMSLSAKHHAAQGGAQNSGSPKGKVSFVNMKDGSSIKVANGGKLYAWGFITGYGSIYAESGAEVFENFQLNDFRGGTATTKMGSGVFPMSQYYIQNIEVPLTIESGAKESCYTSIYMSSNTWGAGVAFFGESGAMFNLTSGKVTKRYDGAKDRLVVSLEGDMSIDPMSMKISSISINSQKYELPINTNITVDIRSGSNVTIAQDVCLLPGAVINVEQGATCTLKPGVSVYIYDADQWGGYCAPSNKTFLPVGYAPGKTYNRTAADLVDAEIFVNGTMDASAGFAYTTEGGANVHSSESGKVITVPGTKTATQQVTQGASSALTYVDIPVTPAKLKNADGTFVETTGTSGTYDYVGGVWVKTCNHMWAETSKTEPTCVTAGSVTYSCACGETKTEEISALGHEMTEATCTEAAHCQRCDYVEGEALGHTEVIDDAIPATCTEPGKSEGKHCSVCGEVLVAQTVVNALGHDMADATCTEASHCKREGCEYTVGSALGHAWNDGVYTVEPTCTEGGEKLFTCDRCGETKTEVVNELGHDIISDVAVEATCMHEGFAAGTHCSRCDYKTGGTVISALGHAYDDGVITTAPTCTEKGVKTFTCTRHCGEEGETYTEPVDALGHTEVVDEAVAPSCTETGLTEGKHCSVCGEVLVAQEEVDALGHEMADATCTEPATCQREGCGYTEGEALGHTEVIDEAVAPSCTETGLTEGKHCSVCGEVLVEQKTVSALGHTQEIIPAVPATCYSVGLTQGTKCSVCGEILVAQEEIEMIPHTLEHVDAKKPTWTSNGWDEFDFCTVEECGYTTQEVIAALGEPVIDNYDEFITNLEILEMIAQEYVKQNPGKDPAALIIKYIRTGVDRYNSGSWEIMAGYEDPDFARFVRYAEDQLNQQFDSVDQYIKVSGLKNLEEFALPNGDWIDIGHMFGTMDITNHNKGSQNHADVGGWAGDLVDLMSVTDWCYYAEGDVQLVPPANFDLETMVKQIGETCLMNDALESGFGRTDYYGDLDALYVMTELYRSGYSTGRLSELMRSYFTNSLNDEFRAGYLLKNRFGGVSTRSQVRDAVFNAYIGNKTIATLEGTREFFNTDSSYISTLRKAACYAFADYLCRIAGDYSETPADSLYEVFSSETSTLAPGITQEIKYATTIDGKQMAYYIATADINRSDVDVYANYANADPSKGWQMARVMDQANAAQARYGDPASAEYIPNYNVIVSTNSDGFNMSTGEPGGLLIMDGKEWHAVNGSGFFGITKEGKAVIGTKDEYNNIYRGQIAEAVGGFGTTLLKDGKITISRTDNYYTSRASRTAVGITKSGKVVLMVLDGRQEPFSCGGSMIEIAQIMLEAGCYNAINLDGGGSTTFVARQEGDAELSVVNRPSDGFQRSVSSTLMMVSTAPSSTAFDHAILEPEYSYSTLNTPVKINAVGVSATGNSAEIPDGATWVVGNANWGSVTEDGVFTGTRYGSVDVYLKLGDDIIGQTTMTMVTPDAVYFTRTTMDAVYGQTIAMPVAALYQGKQVAINERDIKFSLSNVNAGSISGFDFTISEKTTLKNVRITAALAANAEIKGSLTINLYKQGENTFDFDNATGGDRLLAFDRQVSNSTTEDAITYTAIDTGKDMVTSYIFAMDMSQIPIPDQLADLTYMLPGADLTDASAWGFLLQLCQRVSDLTYVTPVLHFDSRFDVDYSELKIINEYFQLTDEQFDEATNTLTLTLNWKKQTQPINPANANPLCIVNGIKLTPKADADWGAKNQIQAENKGSITYRIYLRASALVSFGSNPQNQQVYGLYAYRNPADPSDAGAYFESLYKSYADSYTLSKAVKEGWVIEEGGFAYYVEGKRLTGIQQVDGFYYDFGETGINKGQVKYTGLLKEDGKTYYSQVGKLASGWVAAEDGYYYFFSTADNHAYTGVCKLGNQTYTFDNEGRLIRGAFVETDKGTRYYWAGRLLNRKWIELEEGIYYADDNGYIAYGNYPVKEDATMPTVWWHFDEETGLCTGLCDGFIERDGSLYYCENGKWFYGAVKVDGGIIFCGSNGVVKVNGECYISSSLDYTAGLENGYYWCGEDGYIVANGFATIKNETYYFTDYVRAKGFTKIGDDYYFFNAGNGNMSRNVTLWVSGNNPYGISSGYYDFQADGTMYVPNPNGEKAIVEEDGSLYFTIDGVKQTNGLNELDGEYYYANTNGKLAVSTTVWISSFNDLIAPGSGYFAFDAEGKLIKTGFVTGGGATYYYDNLVRAKGFTKIGEDYYFFNAGSGKMSCDATLWVGSNSYGISSGYYYFQTDGTMYIPNPNGEKAIVEEDGSLYFTIDGAKQTNGLNELDGEYYYANANGKLAVSTTIWIANFNELIAPGSGYFAFDAEGKLIKTGFVTGGGATYYYDNLVRVKGFTKIGEDYYFFNAGSGKMSCNVTLWVGSNSYGIPSGYYNFQADGSMYIPDPNGAKVIVEENGSLYFTIDGAKQTNGLNELDGEYYYANSNGKLAVNTAVWISSFNDLIAPGSGYFAFDAEGKLVKTGFAAGGGATYYYDNLVRAKGFTKIGEDYYFFNAGSGKMSCDITLWVGGNNQYGVASGSYKFGSDGKMITG